MKPKNVTQDGGDWEGIAIIGFTPHKNQAPFDNPDWLVAGLNDLYLDLVAENSGTRFPLTEDGRLEWYQLHPWYGGRPVESMLDFSAGPHHPRDPNHVRWLAEAADRFPVYLREKREEIPNGIVYPYNALKPFFGERLGGYITNSISYMIALAIMRGFKKVGVYGVDMMVAGGIGSEYGYQRPSCEAFIGWALRELGPDNFILPMESDLLAAAYPYADENGNQYRMKMRYEQEEINKRLAHIRQTKHQSELAEAEMVGAANSMERFLRSWMPGDDTKPNPGTAPDVNAHKVR